MSSFLIQPETINRIVTYLSSISSNGNIHSSGFKRLLERFGLTVEREADREELAKAILNLNIEALNQRYGEKTGNGDFAYSKSKGANYDYRSISSSPFQVYFSLRCLIYQCSEGSVPENHLFKFLDELSDTIAHRIAWDVSETNGAKWD